MSLIPGQTQRTPSAHIASINKHGKAIKGPTALVGIQAPRQLCKETTAKVSTCHIFSGTWADTLQGQTKTSRPMFVAAIKEHGPAIPQTASE